MPETLAPPAPAAQPSPAAPQTDAAHSAATEQGMRDFLAKDKGSPNVAPMEARRRKAATPPPASAKAADVSPSVAPAPKTEPPPAAKVEGQPAAKAADAAPATEPKASDIPWRDDKGGIKILDESVVRGMKAGSLTKYNQELVRAYKDLQAKRAEPVSITEHAEFKKVSEQLQQRDKENLQLREQIKFVDYEKSPDYQREFYQPYKEAFDVAHSKVVGWNVIERKDENTGEVVQAARRGTPDDFDRIAAEQDDNVAWDLADKLFGNRAGLAMQHREKVYELNAKKEAALEKYRKEGGAMQEQAVASRKAAQEAQKTVFHTEKQAGIEKNPHLFKAAEGDSEGADVLAKGFAYSDVVFSGAKIKGADGIERNPTPAETAKRSAVVYNKSGGFDYLNLLYRRECSKTKALEAKIAARDASDPGDGGGKGQAGGSNGDEAPKTPEERERHMAKYADRR